MRHPASDFSLPVIRPLVGIPFRSPAKAAPKRHAVRSDAYSSWQGTVRTAASRATAAYKGRAHKCYRTAELTARLLGGDLQSAVPKTGARGYPIAHIAHSVQKGSLKPGMAVYVNASPGADHRSLSLNNRPHWFTYLGKDRDGTLRFSDQFGDRWSLADMVSKYAPRRIDAYFDPFRRS